MCRKRSVFLPSTDQEGHSSESMSVKKMLKWVANLNIKIVYVCILEQHLHLSLSVLQHFPLTICRRILLFLCNISLTSLYFIQSFVWNKKVYASTMYVIVASLLVWIYNWTCSIEKVKLMMCHIVCNKAVSSKWLVFYDCYIKHTHKSTSKQNKQQKYNTIHSRHNVKTDLNSIFQNDINDQHVCDTPDRMNALWEK